MQPVTILDGGMGKELRRIGAPFRQPEWSSLALMEAPDRVVEAHTNFIAAGADVIITNNYAVVPYHHGDGFVENQLSELIDLAGRLAREAADSNDRWVRVAGSLPPLFGSYEPARFDPEQASPIYDMIVAGLDPYVDLWLGETFSRVDEMRTTTDSISRVATGVPRPVWMAFTLPDAWVDEDGIALRSGEPPETIVDAATDCELPIDAILWNCSQPEQTGPAIEALRSAIEAREVPIEIGAYANAFPSRRDEGYEANSVVFERRFDLTPDRYAAFVADWIDLGATIVGGCCDIYPEHIIALASRFGGR